MRAAEKKSGDRAAIARYFHFSEKSPPISDTAPKRTEWSTEERIDAQKAH